MKYQKIVGYNLTCVIFEIEGGKIATVSTTPYSNGIILEKNIDLIRYKYTKTDKIPSEQLNIAIERLNEWKNVKDYTISEEESHKLVRERIENAKRNHTHRQ